jgi:hypothetical protein
MKNSEALQKILDNVFNSTDGIERAKPAPFLLTRIQAKLAGEQSWPVWEKITAFCIRPSVLYPALGIIIFINIAVIVNNEKEVSKTISEQFTTAPIDEGTSATTYMYDTENP